MIKLAGFYTEDRQTRKKSKSQENDILYFSNNLHIIETKSSRKKRLTTSNKIPTTQSKYRFIKAFQSTLTSIEILSEKIDKDSQNQIIPVETINELFSSNDNDSRLQIRDYFLLKSQHKRYELVKSVTKFIKNENAVIEVLDWGTSSKIYEGFDAAIMLLEKCGEVIITTLKQLPKPSKDNKDLLISEEKWEILIKSIARATNLDSQVRFDAITQLIPDASRRLIKAAIIDALLIMDDEIDPTSIKRNLEVFISNNEQDQYIQDYAREALEDII